MDKRKIRQGAYATVISVVAIVIILFVNLIVGELNFTVDLTADKRYSLSDQTKELVKGLESKITIYYLVQSGNEITDFKKIIDNYAKIGDKVSVVCKDPVQYPKFASKYVEDEVGTQSFIVVNEDTQKGKYIAKEDAYGFTFNNATGQYVPTQVVLEARIDAAIQAVTNEKLPKIYAVDGHGEIPVSTYMGNTLTDSNVAYDSISTLAAEKIPEDCDILYICQPKSDFVDQEMNMILDYLKNGGKAIICVNLDSYALPNFMNIVHYYGLDVVYGFIREGDSNYSYGRYATMLLPKIYVNDYTKGIKGEKYIVCNYSSGLEERDDKRDTVLISPILKTSDDAYSKTNVQSKIVEKEEGDVEGPFLVGASIDEGDTKIAVYSGTDLWNDQLISNASFGNADLLMNTINYMTGQKNTLSIQGLSLEEKVLSMTQAQKSRVGILVVGIIPLSFLAIGIFVVIQRRKK